MTDFFFLIIRFCSLKALNQNRKRERITLRKPSFASHMQKDMQDTIIFLSNILIQELHTRKSHSCGNKTSLAFLKFIADNF